MKVDNERVSRMKKEIKKMHLKSFFNNFWPLGSGCGAVGREVVSKTRDTRFEYSHRQNAFIVKCIEKTKIKKTYNLLSVGLTVGSA